MTFTPRILRKYVFLHRFINFGVRGLKPISSLRIEPVTFAQKTSLSTETTLQQQSIIMPDALRLICREADRFADFESVVIPHLAKPFARPDHRIIWLEMDGCSIDKLRSLKQFCAKHATQRFRISVIFNTLAPADLPTIISLLYFSNTKVEFLEIDIQQGEDNALVLDIFTALLETPEEFKIRQILPGRFGSRFQNTTRFFQALATSQVTYLEIDARSNSGAELELAAIMPNCQLESLSVALTIHEFDQFMAAVSRSQITELDLSDCEFGEQVFNMEAAAAAAAAVHSSQRLKWLNFGGCQIGTEGLIAIFQPMTIYFGGLTSLDVSSNGMQDTALMELCRSLTSEQCEMQRLVAYDNEFSMQAVVDYVFPLLRHQNCKLLELEIVSEFGTDDERLDRQMIDLAFSRMLFARKLFALTSSRIVKRLGSKAPVRRLPNELFRLVGDMLVSPSSKQFILRMWQEDDEEEEEEEIHVPDDDSNS